VTTLGGQTQIFATANAYSANLGGLSGADAVCMNEANNFGYAGTWKAVLSTSTVNASSRLTILYPVIYAGTSTTIAATNLWNTLSNLMPAYSSLAYTGSNPDGTWAGNSCNDWTDDTGSYYGETGIVNGYANEWLTYEALPCNYNSWFLYCVNQ
jgi:hypothetical protein